MDLTIPETCKLETIVRLLTLKTNKAQQTRDWKFPEFKQNDQDTKKPFSLSALLVPA